MPILNALQTTTTCHEAPFRHWEIEKPLSDAVLAEMVKTGISDRPREYDGSRAGDCGGDGVDGKLRCFVGRDNLHRFPAIGCLVDELLRPDTADYVGSLLQRDLSDAYLRVEVIADRQGFWLKPHRDIKEKLMSMLLYANPYGESESLGTDFYDKSLTLVKTVPYRHNHGYMFAAGDDTWHGLEKKQIRVERRSLLINYVTFPTDWKLSDYRRRAAA